MSRTMKGALRGLGVLLLSIGSAALVTQLAAAQTPDGETPAVEDECDGLVGAEYGLCNAYCEAMDCDGGDPHASATACDKVRGNYMKQSDGEPPPCDAPPVECPCSFPAIGCLKISGASCSVDLGGEARIDYTCTDEQGSFGVAFGVDRSKVCFTKTGRVGGVELFNLTDEQIPVCSDVVFALAPSFGVVCPGP